MATALDVLFTADITDLRTKATLADAVLKTSGASARALAKEYAAAGADIRSGLLPALTQAVQVQTQAQSVVAKLRSETSKLTEVNGSNRSSYMELGHVAKSAFDSLAAGASPLRVIQTEGARVVQAFAEMNGVTLTTIARFAAVAVPIAAAGAALGVLAYQAYEARKALNALDNSTASLGRVSEVTSGAARAMTEELADNYDIGVPAAAKLVAEINQIPEATHATRRALAELTPVIAKLTGQSGEDVAKSLRAGFETVSSIEAFTEKTRLLTPQMQAALDVAKKTGDVFAAQDAVLPALTARYQAYQAAQQAAAKYNPNANNIGDTYEATQAAGLTAAAPKLPDPSMLGEGPSDAQQQQMDHERAKQKEHADSIVAIGDAEIKQRLLQEQKFGTDADKIEVAFWQQKLTTIHGSGETEVAARREINDRIYSLESALHSAQVAGARRANSEELSEAKKLAAEQEAVRREGVQTDLQGQQLDLEAKKSNLQQQVDAGAITIQQKAAQESDLVRQLYAVDEQELTNQTNLLTLGIVERARYNNQIVLMERKKALELQQIQTQLAGAEQRLTVQAATKQREQDKQTSQYAAQSLMGMLEGRQTFVQSAIGLGEKLVERAIAWGIEELLVTVHTQMAKTGAVVAGTTAQVSAKATGAVAGAAIEKSTNTTSVFGDAKAAAAGAYKAVVGIPFIGPVLAPIAAGVAFGAVMAFSAEGGAEAVPYDNAPFLLHRNEMVLPAGIAENVRNMTTNNNGGSFSPTIHVHGSNGKAPTSKDIIRELRNAHRNGEFAHA